MSEVNYVWEVCGQPLFIEYEPGDKSVQKMKVILVGTEETGGCERMAASFWVFEGEEYNKTLAEITALSPLTAAQLKHEFEEYYGKEVKFQHFEREVVETV